jgi:hypothetical protein
LEGKSALPTVFAHTNETIWEEMIAMIKEQPDISQEFMQFALKRCLSEAVTANQTDKVSG